MPEPSPSWTPISNDVSLLPTLRALHECQAEVSRVASRHLDALGLTPARFEILAALGDTEGLTVKELADQSLSRSTIRRRDRSTIRCRSDRRSVASA